MARTEKAAAALNEETAAGATAEVLTSCEKQLQANERLSLGLLKKRNDIVMEVLSKVQVKIGYFALTFASHEKVIAHHEGKNRDHH